jgi:HSP20 family protein
MANNITRYNPASQMMPLSEAMDRLVRDAFTWPMMGDRSTGSGLGWAQWSNLFENAGSYLLQVALPGVSPDNVEITAQQNTLTVHGKFSTLAPEGANSVWAALPSGDFSYQFSLPGEVDAGQASAEFRDGILMLNLPKAAHLQSHTIKIGGNGSKGGK